MKHGPGSLQDKRKNGLQSPPIKRWQLSNQDFPVSTVGACARLSGASSSAAYSHSAATKDLLNSSHSMIGATGVSIRKPNW